jgi:hypothetical protein
MLEKHLGVRFLYAEDEKSEKKAAAEAPLTRNRWPDCLPPGSPPLHEAALSADIDATLTLLDQIHGDHPALSTTLAKLANDFRFDVLMNLTQA